MAMVKCSECGGDLSSEAGVCPLCGKPVAKQANAFGTIAGVIVFFGMMWFFFGGGLDSATQSSMQGISNQVADDAVTQYNIASSQGDPMQKCVQAGLVSAAYLQAENSEKYNLWKAIESGDCAVAGIPH